MAATARSMLPISQTIPPRRRVRSSRLVSRTSTMRTQTKKRSGNFCKLPSQHTNATANQHDGRLRASSEKTIASVVKKVSPMSSMPRLSYVEKRGHENNIATISQMTHEHVKETKQADDPA